MHARLFTRQVKIECGEADSTCSLHTNIVPIAPPMEALGTGVPFFEKAVSRLAQLSVTSSFHHSRESELIEYQHSTMAANLVLLS
jgi:hypothetical protein